jgi:hypothetical protein
MAGLRPSGLPRSGLVLRRYRLITVLTRENFRDVNRNGMKNPASRQRLATPWKRDLQHQNRSIYCCCNRVLFLSCVISYPISALLDGDAARRRRIIQGLSPARSFRAYIRVLKVGRGIADLGRSEVFKPHNERPARRSFVITNGKPKIHYCTP